jgi:diaminopimelate decarboxylase
MKGFAYRDGILHAEERALAEIAAAPRHALLRLFARRAASRYAEFRQALAGRDALVCYAVKANSNLAILNLFARAGAGFDIVSGGELARVLAAGGDPARWCSPASARPPDEMRQALGRASSASTSSPPPSWSGSTASPARPAKTAPIALRVNPDVDPRTHPYISTGLRSNKFGVAYGEALALYRKAATLPHIDIAGIACHIGSQLLDPAPAAEAAGKVLALVDQLAAAGIALRHIDLGGGIGIRYRDEAPPAIADYLAPILAQLAGRGEKSSSSRAGPWSATPASCSPASNTSSTARKRTSPSSTPP